MNPQLTPLSRRTFLSRCGLGLGTLGLVGMLKETVEKQPQLVKTLRSAYIDAVRMIKAGQDEDFFKSKAKEFFNLSTPEEVAAGFKQNQANAADKWGGAFFQSQNKILQSGISLGLLPNIGDLNNLWVK